MGGPDTGGNGNIWNTRTRIGDLEPRLRRELYEVLACGRLLMERKAVIAEERLPSGRKRKYTKLKPGYEGEAERLVNEWTEKWG